jgi:polyhydroxybutyrate depolymerase
VVLYTIDGAGHTWPGRVPDSIYLGTSALGFPANPLILDFFRRHPLAG